jgi:hypothetical protein
MQAKGVETVDEDAVTSSELLDDLDDFDEDFEALYLKYEFDGVGSLEVLAAALRALAAEVELKSALGWELAAPVDGGWVHLRPAGHGWWPGVSPA